MDERLKPCPFCDGEAELKQGFYVIDNYVQCLKCGTRTAFYTTKDRAIKRWNTRKPMNRIVEQLEREIELVVTQFPLHGRYIKKSRAIEIVKGVQNE